MSIDLAKLIVGLRANSKLNAKLSEATIKKMTALAIDPLLVSTSLDGTKAIARDGHRSLIDHLLQKMTLSQLKKLSKAWDPNKKYQKEVSMSEVRGHLTALLNGASLTPKPVKAATPKKSAKSK